MKASRKSSKNRTRPSPIELRSCTLDLPQTSTAKENSRRVFEAFENTGNSLTRGGNW